MGRLRPRFSTILRAPNPTTGDGHAHHVRITRINANGMDSRNIGPTAQPLVAIRVPPQAFHQLPGVTTIRRLEQSAGHGTSPQGALGFRSTPTFQRPDQLRGPIHVLAPAIFVDQALGLLRIFRRGNFYPLLFALIAPVQFDAEVPVVEGGIIGAVARVAQHQRHVITQKMLVRDFPTTARFGRFKQALACRNHHSLLHLSSS